ncbi:putative short-chain oxidoreductase [Usnea florida]
MQRQTWLITGCSSGFGSSFVTEILGRGDHAIATARSLHSLEPLMDAGASCLQLDVTASQTELDTKIEMAEAMFGPIDVLVNNAGYAEVGVVEDCSQEVFQRQYDTNIFGTIKLTRSVLPIFRRRRAGIIIMISSLTGIVGMPGASPYASSKFALEGLSECLRLETAHLNIRTLVVQPGMFRTSNLTPRSHRINSSGHEEYAALNESMGVAKSKQGTQRGDPKKMVERVVDLVKGTGLAESKPMPETLPMGIDAVKAIRLKCEKTLRNLEDWEEISCGTDH